MPITIDSPEAAVAATPYLLGFTPRDSLVLLLLDDFELRVAMRVDLPQTGDLPWLLSVLNGVPDDVPGQVLLMGFADAAPATRAAAVAGWVCGVFAPFVDVLDAVIVAEGRVLPVFEEEDGTTPGRDLCELRNHPVIAECVLAGLSHLSDRDELQAMLEPVRDDVSERVSSLLADDPDGGMCDPVPELVPVRVLTATTELTGLDVACVARACADWRIRDPMFAELLDGHFRGTTDLSSVRTRLTYCLTHTPASHFGAVAASLALLAWSDGDGATAVCAAERAVAEDATNTLAPLVLAALEQGMPPQTWASVTCDIPRDVLRGRAAGA
jgi:hypothetical protein